MDSRRSAAGIDTGDPYGLDESRGPLSKAMGQLVPATVARRAIRVSVTTDREVYTCGDPVRVRVDFKNRFPTSVEIPTPKQRRWGWRIDGKLEASDDTLYTRNIPSTFVFRGGERKQLSFVWNGRFKRTGNPTEWVLPDPGEYELEVFVATHTHHYQPRDSTTIRLES